MLSLSSQTLLWLIFGVVVAVMLVLDLSFNARRKHLGFKAAVLWSFVWISIALAFNLLVYFWKGQQVAFEFLTAYLVEESLSVDNLFVFLLIFSYFNVPRDYQRKALLWGILGVIIMRGVFIFAGVSLISKFHWALYVFGAFLVFTAIKMVFHKDQEMHPDENPVLKIFKKLMPVTKDYHGDRFFIKEAGKFFATPLFVVVLVIETTDVVFAVDSIPAVLGITQDPLIIYTSNIFAVLGLRSLYFALSGFMGLFHHLHYGLSAVLGFIGLKMLTADIIKVPITLALGIVAGILILSVITSIIWPKKNPPIPPLSKGE